MDITQETLDKWYGDVVETAQGVVTGVTEDDEITTALEASHIARLGLSMLAVHVSEEGLVKVAVCITGEILKTLRTHLEDE